MRRSILLALLLLVGAALWPPRLLAIVQNFLASDTVLTSSQVTTVLSAEWLVTSTSEQFFLLANVRVFNQNNGAVQLTVTLDEASAAFTPETIPVIVVPAASEITVQVPLTVAALALGPYTARIKCTAQTGGALVLQTDTYLGIFSATVPGSVVVDINGSTCAAQTFDGDADGSLTISTVGCVHTFETTPAGLTQAGIVTTSAQILGDGIKTFPAGIISRQPSVAQTTRIGASAIAAGVGDVAIGDGCQANGGGNNGVCIGSAGLATGSGSVGIGPALDNTGNNTVGIGHNYEINQPGAVAVGASAHGEGEDCAAFGISAQCLADFGTALGASSQATAVDTTALGNLATATEASATAVGAGATAGEAGCIALGAGAACSIDNELVIGGPGVPITVVRTGVTGGQLGSSGFPFSDAFFNEWNNAFGDSLTLDSAGNLVTSDPTADVGTALAPFEAVYATDLRNTSGFRWSVSTAGAQLTTFVTGGCGGGGASTAAGLIGGLTCDDLAGTSVTAWQSPDAWTGGTLDIEFASFNHNATPSGVMGYDITCHCRGGGEVIGSMGSPANLDTTYTTQDAMEHQTTTVACSGSCQGGDTVMISIDVDTTATTTQATDTALVAMRMSYTRAKAGTSSFFE